MTDDKFNRFTPQDLEAEEYVLGAMCLTSSAVTQGVELLVPESFYLEKNQIIFKAIQTLNENEKPVDILTITDQLRKMDKMKEVGGPGYISSLTNKIGSDAHFEEHCFILKEKHLAREQMHLGMDLYNKGTDPTQDVFKTNEFMADEIYRIQNLGELSTTHTTEDLAREMMQGIEQAKKQEGITGTPTGFPKIDRTFGGLQPGNMIVIAGRPGMGKTAFMTSITYNQVVKEQKTVIVFSHEMTALELFKRYASIATEIDAKKFRTGEMDEDDWKQFNHKIQSILNDRLIIVDDCVTMQDIINRTKKERISREIHAVYIDYLQLVEGKGKNRQEEISYCSRQTKLLAKSIQAPVIAFAQLSRDVEKRTNKRPILSDLRESGSIEQDADIVGFLHRERYYNAEAEDPYTYFIIAKYRNGRLKDIAMNFIHARTQFVEAGSELPF